MANGWIDSFALGVLMNTRGLIEVIALNVGYDLGILSRPLFTMMVLMAAAVELLRPYPNIELIWASPRELLNIFHADAVGCHIITVTHDILNKLSLVGKDLAEYSLDTVRMFYQDARGAGFQIETK